MKITNNAQRCEDASDFQSERGVVGTSCSGYLETHEYLTRGTSIKPTAPACTINFICPSKHRIDPRTAGWCYCGFYVSESVIEGEKSIAPMPERRKPPEERERRAQMPAAIPPLTRPVWRYRVCGYLCAHDGPPGVCPIYRVKKERFERFM